jgi:hypothetical protein
LIDCHHLFAQVSEIKSTDTAQPSLETNATMAKRAIDHAQVENESQQYMGSQRHWNRKGVEDRRMQIQQLGLSKI